MGSKFRIGIIGIGGIGGFFGGKLAAAYKNSKEIEVVFIVRGQNKKVIEKNGIKIISSSKEIIANPSLVAENCSEAGILDLLIVCVKNYDLETILQTIQPCLNRKTIILPLLNGVDATDRIKKTFPEQEVWQGCVYSVTRLIEPGIIKDSGKTHALYFGSEEGDKAILKQVETIFKNAEINAIHSDDINQTIWEKYLFVSTIATLTCFIDRPIGEILSNENERSVLLKLLTELHSVALSKNIPLSENIIDTTLQKMEALPFETTSSMHYDLKNGNKTEYKALIEYITLAGDTLNIETPFYDGILKTFIK